MKRFLLAGVALAALTGTVSAADLPRRVETYTKAPAYVEPAAYNWTGWYVGINGGGAIGRSSYSGTPSTGSFDVSGGLGGLTMGYNWQAANIVYGIEGDIDYADIRGSAACGASSCQTTNEWLGTLRGRIGYTGFGSGNVMPYITGGLAVGDVHARVPGIGGRTETQTGYTVGGGIEYALSQNWTAKAEYLFVDLGKFDCGIACGGIPPDRVDFQSHIVRAGINYKF
jgi:outer membrane immunogenic protein